MRPTYKGGALSYGFSLEHDKNVHLPNGIKTLLISRRTCSHRCWGIASVKLDNLTRSKVSSLKGNGNATLPIKEKNNLELGERTKMYSAAILTSFLFGMKD